MLNEIKSKVIEALKEFSISSKNGPFSKRVYKCSKCDAIEISKAKPKENGCFNKGKHDWYDIKARF